MGHGFGFCWQYPELQTESCNDPQGFTVLCFINKSFENEQILVCIPLLLGWYKSWAAAELQIQAASLRSCSMVTMLNICCCCCSSKVFQLTMLQLFTVPQHHPTSLNTHPFFYSEIIWTNVILELIPSKPFGAWLHLCINCWLIFILFFSILWSSPLIIPAVKTKINKISCPHSFPFGQLCTNY